MQGTYQRTSTEIKTSRASSTNESLNNWSSTNESNLTIFVDGSLHFLASLNVVRIHFLPFQPTVYCFFVQRLRTGYCIPFKTPLRRHLSPHPRLYQLAYPMNSRFVYRPPHSRSFRSCNRTFVIFHNRIII